jgi:hypothetical protein
MFVEPPFIRPTSGFGAGEHYLEPGGVSVSSGDGRAVVVWLAMASSYDDMDVWAQPLSCSDAE